ncbi:hypothetical protein B7939_00655 [Eggerthia catenaformis]|nr:hypothetical protein B7939_00655 [Eggerthia catenaformis]
MSNYEKIKLKNGKIRYRKYVSLGNFNGKRKSTRITADTIKELKKKEAELLLNKRNILSSSISFEHAYILYLKDIKNKIADTTFSYKEYNKDVFSCFNNIQISKITDNDLIYFLNKRAKEVKMITVSKDYSNLSSFLKWCYKKKIIDRNPIDFVDKPKFKKSNQIFYTEDEFWKLYNVSSNFYKVVFMTLFFTGLRKGELCALSKNDLIDYELHLNHTVKYVPGVGLNIYDDFKTQNSKRIVPIPKFLKYDLEEVLSSKEYPFFKIYNSMWKYLKRTINNNNLKPLRIHDFRHSYAALLINKGVNIYTVSQILGHTDIRTTTNTYGHLYDSIRKEITDLF